MKSSSLSTLLLIQLPLAFAFGPLWRKAPCPSRTTRLCMSSPPSPEFPPLGVKDIQEILDQVPVFAITSIQNDSILLVEEDSKNVANFFLSKDFADTVVSGHEDTLRVDAYSLGKIYFQLFDPDESLEKAEDFKAITMNDKDVEYRIVPDTREVDQAQSILTQMADDVDEAFSQGYDEIPLFMDQHLRLATGSEEDGDYMEIFPIYFGWNDLATTCQEYVRAFAEAGEEYDAAISVSELKQLVEQMKKPSPVDFSEVRLVPASPRPSDSELAKISP
jgi:hypothetical protein